MTRILIEIPTFDTILPETFKAVYGLEIPKGCTVHFDFKRGYGAARARNLIAGEAVQLGYDWLLMVDSDVLVPRNTLLRLTQTTGAVCLGCYPRRHTQNGVVELFRTGQKDYVETFTSAELDLIQAPFEVKGGGFGCAMIRVEALRALPKPWFRYVEYPNGAVLSEDNYFCGQVRASGRKVFADPQVRCGHAGRTIQWR